MPIEAAKLHFNASGTPVSRQFDDIYYSTEDGMAETEYVFLDGNGLPARWTEPDSDHFVIGETGFGTGLNFLTTWHHHRKLCDNVQQLPRLHFISFELYPLSSQDLSSALSQWPQLTGLTEQLLKQYPEPLQGCHRMSFDNGRVILDLWMGDIIETLPQLFQSRSGYFDAWYLDGFAPVKNAGMWHPQVLNGIAQLSKPGATIATFTCARIVKDALSGAGFVLSKRKGFAKKREMLQGVLGNKPEFKPAQPYHYRHQNHAGKQVAVIGGGIASAAVTHALAQKGYDISLYCKDTALAQGASQNRQGALYPLLHATFSPLSEFYAHAYTFALRQYHQLLSDGLAFEHDFCGVILQTFNETSETRHNALIRNDLWPEHLIQALDAEQCSDVAGLELPHKGLYFADGGWINPSSLINAYLEAARQLTRVEMKLNRPIDKLIQNPDKTWQVDGTTYDNVVVCCGHLTNTFEQTKTLALSPIRGQVSHLDAIEQTKKLKTVLCYSGYITPAKNNQHCIGASFIKGDSSTEIRAIEHQRNLERLQLGLGDPSWFGELKVPSEGKASIRCASVDHLPLIGAVPDFAAYHESYSELYKGLKPQRYPLPPDYDNLYILSALGARGLCSAPLGAQIIAAQMSNAPYPVPNRVLDALNPGRGLIKALKRNKPFNGEKSC